MLKCLLSFSMLFTQLLFANNNLCPNHVFIYAHHIANWFQRASLNHHFSPVLTPKTFFIQSIINIEL